MNQKDLTLCWAYGTNPSEPCWGKITASEDYPGLYSYYCEGHGHHDDNLTYKAVPTLTRTPK